MILVLSDRGVLCIMDKYNGAEEYKNLLKRKEWKDFTKKVSILNGSKCNRCENTKALQTHHLRYDRSKYPWEYEMEDLETLCSRCHRIEHNSPKPIKEKESFFLMYDSMINVLKGCNDPKIILLAGLIERYSSGQSFAMTQHLKDEIGVGVNCSVLSFNRAFTELKRANIIVEPKSRLYKINPRFVFKGSSNNRSRHLKVVLEYCKEC